jgi:hypothetical protein
VSAAPQTGLIRIQPLMQAADIDQLRYGGGSYADYYDWQSAHGGGDARQREALA